MGGSGMRDALDSINAGQQIDRDVSRTTRGTRVHHRRRHFLGGGISDKTFTVEISGLTASVTAGTLRLHNVGNFSVAASSFAITGNPAWITVVHARDHSSTQVLFFASEPVSEIDFLRVPLCKCSLNDSATAYVKEFTCHDGDINLDTPLQ